VGGSYPGSGGEGEVPDGAGVDAGDHAGGGVDGHGVLAGHDESESPGGGSGGDDAVGDDEVGFYEFVYADDGFVEGRVIDGFSWVGVAPVEVFQGAGNFHA